MSGAARKKVSVKFDSLPVMGGGLKERKNLLTRWTPQMWLSSRGRLFAQLPRGNLSLQAKLRSVWRRGRKKCALPYIWLGYNEYLENWGRKLQLEYKCGHRAGERKDKKITLIHYLIKMINEFKQTHLYSLSREYMLLIQSEYRERHRGSLNYAALPAKQHERLSVGGGSTRNTCFSNQPNYTGMSTHWFGKAKQTRGE
jgi:hypothetical protein